MNLPPVVSPAEWRRARQELLAKEKEATRARDALAAERRRLPMVRIDKDYAFDGPEGKATLLDLFEGRRQLIVYHFMFAPGVEGWPSAGCDGCSMVVDNIGHLAHLHARDTSLVLVSRAPLEQVESYRERMGWAIPWFSSSRSDFNRDFGVTADEGETFGGLARGITADPAVPVVAPPRRVRRLAAFSRRLDSERDRPPEPTGVDLCPSSGQKSTRVATGQPNLEWGGRESITTGTLDWPP